MVILSKEMNTKYICDWHAGELRAKLQSWVGKDTVDLAGCSLTPGAASVIDSFYGVIKFCNSADKKLDAILKHNEQAVLEKKKPAIRVQVPTKFKSMDEVKAFINSLEVTDIVSASSAAVNPIITFKVLELIQGLRPKIVVDLAEYAKAYFEDIRSNWLSVAEHSDVYYEAIGEAVVSKRVENGMVDDSDYGLIDEAKYRTKRIVIPKKFGEVKLVGDKEFKGVLDSAIETLERLTKPAVRMIDFLQTGEGDD